MAALQPFFSIVIPTYNCAALLEGAMRSVAEQRCRDYELVVSDGASRDGTQDTVERLRAAFPAVTLLSRPDAGIYDAINQGVAASRGRWIYVLGSDDRLHGPDVLSAMKPALASDRERFVYGDVEVVGDSALGPDGARYGGRFDFRRLLQRNICQQAIFYRKDLFETLGPFDSRYRLFADWHLAMRTIVAEPTRWVDIVVCDYATSGTSAMSADTAFMQDFRPNVKRLLASQPMRIDLWWACMRHAWQGRVDRLTGTRAPRKTA